MKRSEETTHPCYKPVRKTKKHIAEKQKGLAFYILRKAKKCFFIYGAEWADKTMLDRACEWLKSSLACGDDYIGDKVVIAYDYETVEEFITAFRQAMEGGAE